MQSLRLLTATRFHNTRLSGGRGWTLVELVIVVAIVALLASIAMILLDPVRRLHAARNTRRSQDVSSLASAVSLARADQHSIVTSDVDAFYRIEDGPRPATVPPECLQACNGVPVLGCHYLLDEVLVGQGYLRALPKDPLSQLSRDYAIAFDNQITIVRACSPEGVGPAGTGPVPNIEVAR